MADAIQNDTKNFFQKVYGWMFAGLIISGITSYYTAASGLLERMLESSPGILIGLIVFELILVIAMAFFIKKMPPALALICFLLFAFVNGLTLSVIFLTYDIKSIAMAFFVTAGMFGLMSFYGMVTNTDLTKIGSIMFMGLIGVIIASVVNMFIKSGTVDFVISIITVIVFTGLTAYDTQKLKMMSTLEGEHAGKFSNIAITGALSLYLDFINLFLSLLRIFGKEK